MSAHETHATADPAATAGAGRQRLSPHDAAPTTFELAEATPTSTGALIATYRPARQPA